MKFDTMILFNRPGEETEVSKWIFGDISGFAEQRNIKILYYTKGDTIGVRDNTLFVAIGGDGTMLRAMDVSLRTNIYNGATTSVVGFNAGNLGFLTIDGGMHQPSWILEQIYLDGVGVRLDERLALSTTVGAREHFALNEFTFTPKNIASSLSYQIDINDKYVTQQTGSGCLVATATGSTAMSMSAGGAILCPSTDVMQIVPIIPHTLSSRPIIAASKDHITISSEMERVDEVVVSSDGRQVGAFLKELEDEAEITVKKAEQPVRVWYNKRREFFNILSTKLDW